MSKLDEKLAEGRALRKAARAVVETDLALLRSGGRPAPSLAGWPVVRGKRAPN